MFAKLPKHCFVERSVSGAQRLRFDWNETCRSKYKPHIGAKQIKRGLASLRK